VLTSCSWRGCRGGDVHRWNYTSTFNTTIYCCYILLYLAFTTYYYIYLLNAYCKTRIFRVHQIFVNFASRIKSRLPIKGLVNTSRTLGKRQIKMQRNFYIPKSQKNKMQRKYSVLQYYIPATEKK